MGVPARECLETFDVRGNFVLGSKLYEYPGPLDGVKSVQYHHGSLGVPVFLFLLYQCVVKLVFLDGRVHRAQSRECPVCDDFS